jgi:hypothetical protein
MTHPEIPQRDIWPPRLSEEEKIRRELQELEAVYKEWRSTPEKARAFLRDAGIMDENGNLAEPYR